MIVNVINHFDIDFLMPISKIDENMERAHKRNAVLTEKFWFRIDIVSDSKSSSYKSNTLKDTDYLYSHEDTNSNS